MGLLMKPGTKSGHSHGHSLTSSEEGAATTVMKILAHTTLDFDSCSKAEVLCADVTTSTEGNTWAPEVVTKPSHSKSTGSTPHNRPDADHNPSSFGLVVDVLRSTGAMKPTDQQIACTIEQEERDEGTNGLSDHDGNERDKKSREYKVNQKLTGLLPTQELTFFR